MKELLPAPDRALSIFMVSAWAIIFFAFLPLYLNTFHSFDIDFSAFYCGGRVLLEGENPYIQGPLHDCEAAVFFKDPKSEAIIPVPLLGYAIAAFEPLARLDPAVASVVWKMLLCAVLAFTIVLLRRIAGFGWAPTFLVVVVADGIISLTLGQIVPICVLGLLLIADALQRERAWQIAIGMLLLCGQPQVAAPVALSLLIFGSARTRLATLVGSGAVLALTLWAVGVAETKTYVLIALPLHAFAELVNANQLSLSALLFQSGVPASVALALGTASYAVLSLFGIVAGWLLSKRFSDRAFLALMPAACAICLGTFVHQQMYAMAVPFGLLALRYMPLRAIAALVIFVAIPWSWVTLTMYLFPITALTCALLAQCWITRSGIRLAAIALAVAGCLVPASLTVISHFNGKPLAYHFHVEPQALVQYAWISMERTFGPIGAGTGLTISRLFSVLSLATLLIVAPIAASRLHPQLESKP